jgi:hypothetical protein
VLCVWRFWEWSIRPFLKLWLGDGMGLYPIFKQTDELATQTALLNAPFGDLPTSHKNCDCASGYHMPLAFGKIVTWCNLIEPSCSTNLSDDQLILSQTSDRHRSQHSDVTFPCGWSSILL